MHFFLNLFIFLLGSLLIPAHSINRNNHTEKPFLINSNNLKKRVNYLNFLTSNKKENSEYFEKLPSRDSIKTKTSIGKQDPFSYGENINNNTFKGFYFLGVISAYDTDYALVEYKNKIGEIKIGDIGGKTTMYLPDNFKLKEINPDIPQIVIKSNEKEYNLNLN